MLGKKKEKKVQHPHSFLTAYVYLHDEGNMETGS